MPKAQRSRSARAREAKEQQRRDDARQAHLERTRRKQRNIGIGVIAVAMLATAGTLTVVGTQSKSVETAAGSTTTSVSVPDPGGKVPTANPGPPASLPAREAGASSSEAMCPAADGSSPRTTSFSTPPPMCIDTANKEYTATIYTSADPKPITVALTTDPTPNTVNNFVVLSRYHFYDGMPVNRIVPGGWFEVGTADPAGAGYTIPGEAPPRGMLFDALSLGVVEAQPGTGLNNGGILLGIPDASNRIADTPVTATRFGTVLDGLDAVRVIAAAGRADGQPAAVYTIERIEITETPRTTPPSSAG